MNQPANPEAETPHELPPVTINKLLRRNLRAAEHFTGEDGGGFDTLWLKSSGEGDYDLPFTQEIHGDCDLENRAMLDRLYEIMDADMQAVSIEESDRDNDYVRRTGRYSRRITIPTADGVTFLEHYAREGDWKSFHVTVVSSGR